MKLKSPDTPRHPSPLIVPEVEDIARKKLPKHIYEFYAFGSDEQKALVRNEKAFDRCVLSSPLQYAFPSSPEHPIFTSAAGYQALILTVDTPVLGNRLAERQTAVTLPPGMKLPNLDNKHRASESQPSVNRLFHEHQIRYQSEGATRCRVLDDAQLQFNLDRHDRVPSLGDQYENHPKRHHSGLGCGTSSRTWCGRDHRVESRQCSRRWRWGQTLCWSVARRFGGDISGSGRGGDGDEYSSTGVESDDSAGWG
ncbi:S-2-hydroxy-acid oxidase [Aspergillus affinis]|uniref:S-2-hydroxy-acid oxidase n=1 Tax=Aspergillus affinis TaxID=1070780 RepID=UPI0022FF1DF5|nr:S-2-hydroxy-acid oxidase [Aspergillus affinis]KAI9046018.1 S-2-hydroxy-acid oxidase [Aspergillus affinis]